jgi:hypothetical protein
MEREVVTSTKAEIGAEAIMKLLHLLPYEARAKALLLATEAEERERQEGGKPRGTTTPSGKYLQEVRQAPTLAI